VGIFYIPFSISGELSTKLDPNEVKTEGDPIGKSLSHNTYK